MRAANAIAPCDFCGQPIRPGINKKGEYEHASGCPLENKEVRQKYWSQRYRDLNREKERLRCRRYSRTKRRRIQRDPIKQRARAILRNAVASGKILKPKRCSGCGARAVLHGHHEDYLEPLAVEWLCSICHGLKHRKPAIQEGAS